MFLQDKVIYHMRDTGIFMDMKLIGELHPMDYLMVPVGDI